MSNALIPNDFGKAFQKCLSISVRLIRVERSAIAVSCCLLAQHLTAIYKNVETFVRIIKALENIPEDFHINM